MRWAMILKLLISDFCFNFQPLELYASQFQNILGYSAQKLNKSYTLNSAHLYIRGVTHRIKLFLPSKLGNPRRSGSDPSYKYTQLPPTCRTPACPRVLSLKQKNLIIKEYFQSIQIYKLEGADVSYEWRMLDYWMHVFTIQSKNRPSCFRLNWFWL